MEPVRPYLADTAAGGPVAVQQDVGQGHPQVRPLQVELHQQVAAAAAQHAAGEQTQWSRGRGSPHPHARSEPGGPSPVAPLLHAARQVCRHLPDAFITTAAAAQQQGQARLEQPAGTRVPVLAARLRLGQDQLH